MSTTSLFSPTLADTTSRPLEADLYSADQQGLDQENISATGNLNIGVVIDYDARAERQMNGTAETAEHYSSDPMQLDREPFHVQPAANSSESPVTPYHSDNSSLLQNAAASGAPNLRLAPANAQEGFQAAGPAEARAASAPAFTSGGGAAVPAAAGSPVSSEDHGAPSSSYNNVTYVTNIPAGNDSSTTYNITNNYYAGDTVTYNNVTNNHYTYNYDYDIDVNLDLVDHVVHETGDIVTAVLNSTTSIINHLGGGAQDVVINLVNTITTPATTIIHQVPGLITSIINETGDITQHVTGAVTDVLTPALGTVNDTLADVIHFTGDVLIPVENLLEQTLGSATCILEPFVETLIQTVENVTAPVETLLDQTLGTVNHLLPPVTDLAENILGGDGHNLLEQIIHDTVGTAGDLADVAQAAAGGLAGVLENIPAQDVTHVVTTVSDALQGDIEICEVLETVQSAVADIIAPVTDIVSDTLTGTLETLAGGHAHDLLETIVGTVNTALEPLSDMITGALGQNGNDLLDASLHGLTPFGATGTTDNDLIDVDILSHASSVSQDNDLLDIDLLSLSSGGAAAQDNDLVDLDLLGLGQTPAAASDNDLIDVDLGLLGHGTAAPAAEDHDLIDLDLSLLSGDTGGGQNGIVDASLLIDAGNAPIVGPLTESLSLPVIEIDTSHLLANQEANVVSTLTSTLQTIVQDTAVTAGDLATTLLELNALGNTGGATGGVMPADTGTLLGGLDTLIAHDTPVVAATAPVASVAAPVVNILPVLPPPVVIAPPATTGGLLHGFGFHH